jgi:hypothetical protein
VETTTVGGATEAAEQHSLNAIILVLLLHRSDSGVDSSPGSASSLTMSDARSDFHRQDDARGRR